MQPQRIGSLFELICVNTAVANKVVEEAINAEVIKELTGYQQVQSEVKYVGFYLKI